MQLGLIGYPLSHSFSPKYFTEKFMRENLKGHTYESFPLANISKFPELLKNHPELSGLNVTIPYKQDIIPLLDNIDETAKAIGAVNTVVIDPNGHTKGFNTDVIGFLAPIENQIKDIKSALILGSGGASKAVVYALQDCGVEVQVVSRNPINTQSISYEQLNHIDTYDLIVNCTPLGMSPNESSYPRIPYDRLNQKQTLYDLVYNPAETVFLRKGSEQGCKAINGYPMLVAQAEASWDIWKNNKH